jgi:hypothetical protein
MAGARLGYCPDRGGRGGAQRRPQPLRRRFEEAYSPEGVEAEFSEVRFHDPAKMRCRPPRPRLRPLTAEADHNISSCCISTRQPVYAVTSNQSPKPRKTLPGDHQPPSARHGTVSQVAGCSWTHASVS